MSVAMQSIMENASPKRRYCFFILQQNLSSENQEKLLNQVVAFPQFSLSFIDVKQYLKSYAFKIREEDKICYTAETFFRLLLPWILADYDKALYFDGDTVCRIDVAEIFDLDLQDKLLAAVREFHGAAWYYKPNKTHNQSKKIYNEVLANLQQKDDYFQAGVLLWNLAGFREDWSIEKLLTLAVSKIWRLVDQDVLNFIAENKTLLLPAKYNYTVLFSELVKYLPKYLQEEYYEAGKDPKIIHYKPWDSLAYIQHFEFFWQYAVKSPFLKIIIANMKAKDLILTTPLHRHIRKCGWKFLLKCLFSREF
ncbi:lipopolysaccharide biosynthesis proteins [Candidatus Termititenax aidoneus]|uniref:Lipopolysaccharide biosynthesis proteins n=1 Tax=Termititenax aidoneus TaxID=2218524 RepID=A0A388T9Z1_TERA1|nr:lipopolysaccharide biosynthesis proteins [Candidatus Termititenax aidoneus]